MTNNRVFSLVSDETIAKHLPYKKNNIVYRYKKVPNKILVYNGMQLMAYMEENNITEEQLLIALKSIVSTKEMIIAKLGG